MTVAVPRSLDELLRVLADEPDAMLLAGGTDAMVEVNEGHRRPPGTVVALDRVTELRSWTHDPGERTVTLGAAVTYTELMEPPLAELLPALAEASRTVGSPQIRNAGTIGGGGGATSARAPRRATACRSSRRSTHRSASSGRVASAPSRSPTSWSA